MSDQKTEQKPEHEKRIRGAICPGDFTMVEVPDLIATLADLDAMRGALERIAAWHEGEQVTPSFDEPHAAAVARAALSEAKAGGWVAVPVEPTQAMLDAADKVQDGFNFGLDDIYKAMLAARPLPAPPAQKDPT